MTVISRIALSIYTYAHVHTHTHIQAIDSDTHTIPLLDCDDDMISGARAGIKAGYYAANLFLMAKLILTRKRMPLYSLILLPAAYCGSVYVVDKLYSPIVTEMTLDPRAMTVKISRDLQMLDLKSRHSVVKIESIREIRTNIDESKPELSEQLTKADRTYIQLNDFVFRANDLLMFYAEGQRYMILTDGAMSDTLKTRIRSIEAIKAVSAGDVAAITSIADNLK